MEYLKKKISVIIPVYNCEKQLRRCIDSILKQSYDETEVILVDDGSTDTSGKICRDYVLKDARVQLIHQRNKGVSSARNKALRNMHGEYVIFCDSDDYYEKDAFEKMYYKAEETHADWIVGAVEKKVFGKKEIVSGGNCVALSGQAREHLIFQLTENFMLNQLWGKLYRTSIIMENNLYMRTEMSCGEDLEWICRFVEKAKTIVSISDITYHYIVEKKNSLSQRFNSDYFLNIEKQYYALKHLYQEEEMWELYGINIMKRQALNILSGYAKVNSRSCTLSIKEKLAYVKDGIKLESIKECRSYSGKLLGGGKAVVLHMNTAVGIVLLMTLMRGRT